MWLKMCPKCGGDLYLRAEVDGNDIVCLQCGQARPAPLVQQPRPRQELGRRFAPRRLAA